MSGKVSGAVWELELERPKRWVLLAMADNAHDDGSKCFPGVFYLAWKTDYSERQIQRILRDLENDKLIEAVLHEDGGRGRATEYTIHTENGVKKSPFRRKKKGDAVSPLPSVKGDISAVKGDISAVKGDIWVSPQPSENRHKEPSSVVDVHVARDHEQNYSDLIEEALDDDPAAEKVWEFIDLQSSRNSGGRKKHSAIWNQIVRPYSLWRDDFSVEARVAGLEGAIQNEAHKIGYARTVAAHYKPRERTYVGAGAPKGFPARGVGALFGQSEEDFEFSSDDYFGST